jgi:hypothetical protein
MNCAESQLRRGFPLYKYQELPESRAKPARDFQPRSFLVDNIVINHRQETACT